MTHIVHAVNSLAVGGTESGTVNVIAALERDFRHTLVSMTTGGPLADRVPPSVPVSCLGKRPGLDGRFILRLARYLRRLRPDIVHSRNWGAVDAVIAARLAGVRVVVHGEHGREASDPQGLDPRRRRIRRMLVPLVTRFVTVSADLRSWLVEYVGIPAAKVTNIYNGVDTARFAEGGREVGRQLLGVDHDAVVFGSVGRLDPVKDHVGLLDAFARADFSGAQAHLVIVGDGPCRKALAERCRQSDLEGRARLLGARDDVASLLRGMDVYVLPSIAEGISNTILEAMACGLPVLATRTGGNPELVQDGVTGALVPVGDRAALARALEAFVEDSHLRSTRGKAGRQRAVEEFSMDRMASRYRELYREISARRAAGRRQES